MGKHTPGPWFVEQGKQPQQFEICVSVPLEAECEHVEPETELAAVAYCEAWPVEESAANALLIAAAPDLLAALEAFGAFDCNCSRIEWDNGKCAHDLRIAALNKAVGR